MAALLSILILFQIPFILASEGFVSVIEKYYLAPFGYGGIPAGGAFQNRLADTVSVILIIVWLILFVAQLYFNRLSDSRPAIRIGFWVWTIFILPALAFGTVAGVVGILLAIAFV